MRFTHLIYAGNVQIMGDLTLQGHAAVRKHVLKTLRELNRQNESDVHFRACSEIGGNGRIHYHFMVYSDIVLSQSVMKSLWNAACYPIPTIVMFDPPREGIEACSKYTFKHLVDVRRGKRFIRLFAPNTLPIAWGTRGFFQPTKAAVWNEIRKGWK